MIGTIIVWCIWLASDIPNQFKIPLAATLIWILWRTSGRRD